VPDGAAATARSPWTGLGLRSEAVAICGQQCSVHGDQTAHVGRQGFEGFLGTKQSGDDDAVVGRYQRLSLAPHTFRACEPVVEVVFHQQASCDVYSSSKYKPSW
jgi:hypothetical protein